MAVLLQASLALGTGLSCYLAGEKPHKKYATGLSRCVSLKGTSAAVCPSVRPVAAQGVFRSGGGSFQVVTGTTGKWKRRQERTRLAARPPPRSWDPASQDPPEADEDDNLQRNKFDKLNSEIEKSRKAYDAEYGAMSATFKAAAGLPIDPPGSAARVPDDEDDVLDIFGKAKGLAEKPAIVEAESDEGELASDEEEEEEEEEEEARPVVRPTGRKAGSSMEENFDLEFEGLERLQAEEPAAPLRAMTLAELLEEAGVVPLSVEGDPDVLVRGIAQDSREVRVDDIFVCVVGQTVDGHKYAGEAVEKGAVVVVASRDVEVDDSLRALVMVEDTTPVVAALAATLYGQPSQKLAVIGITGTNGKTTTSHLLKGMCEAMGMRTGLIGTIAYHVAGRTMESGNTTPDALRLQKLFGQMVEGGEEACVMEVSSHALALGRVHNVDFDIAVFTNLTRDHMDFHGTEEAYREAKGRLFAKMTDPGRHRKVVNIDDPNAEYFIAQGSPDVPVVTFGMENSAADVYPLEVQLSLFETELVVRTPRGNVEVSSGLLGRHNVYNILAALAVGIAMEAPLEDVLRGIEEVDAVPGRMELIDEEQAFAVIVDYAHSPDALSRLLDTVRECGPQRIITVVGCGGDRDKGKRPIMAKIATDKSDVTIITSDNPRSEEPLDIIDDMLAGVGWTMDDYLSWGEDDLYPALPNGHRLYVYDLRSVAVRAAVAMGEEGDAVVVAGKGHETYQIIGAEKQYFDDREECRDALLHVGSLHAAGVDTSEFPWRVPDI